MLAQNLLQDFASKWINLIRFGPMLRKLAAFLFGLVIFYGLNPAARVSPAAAQSGVTVHSNQASYQFGQLMRFSLEATSETPVESAALLFSTPDMPNTLTAQIDLTAAEEVAISHQIDLRQIRFQPFAPVTWVWSLTLESGQEVALEAETVLYRDDRFIWSGLDDEQAAVYWAEGDATLGQAALDSHAESLARIQEIVPATLPQIVQIYLYPTSSDLQAALRLTGYEWAGGHASPDLAVILIALPSQVTAEVELRRTLPHELTHLLLAEATGPSYEQLPAWFEEGLATYFEIDQNPAFAALVQDAVDSGSTIHFSELCLDFPHSGEQALLAYAQSRSLVEMIQAEYGNHTLTQFVIAFRDGSGCEGAVQRVLGISLQELERSWQAQLRTRPAIYRTVQRLGWWIGLALAGFVAMVLLARNPLPRRKLDSDE